MTLSTDILLAEYEDIATRTAQHLLQQHRGLLPDFSPVCIITPTRYLSTDFRKAILRGLPADQCAVIPPYIGTLRQWISDNTPLPDPAVDLLSEQARQLLFVEALNEHPALFKDENKWQVSAAMLTLFDELALNEIGLLELPADDWLAQLKTAYGCESSNAHLQQEARLIHTLWHAWQQQLQDDSLMDESGAYLARLKQAARLHNNRHFYLIDPDHLSACERHAVEQLAKTNTCIVAAYGNTTETRQQHAGAATSAFINAVYDHSGTPLKQRAEHCRRTVSVDALPFSIFYSGDAETEARAVELQVRLWLLQGKQSIGIVSEDRKLSRRVRALLERADVSIQDIAGWSLATTSAAAVLERWLECIEEDFDYRPMLDLLKSPCFRSALDRERHLETVYRLENDIILHENVSHGLKRYRKQLDFRLKRLPNWPADTYDNVVQLLDQLEKAAHYLQQLYRSNRKSGLNIYLDALADSLQQLGIIGSFADDAAGLQILNALEAMRSGLRFCSPDLRWHDFRTWLGITLEQQLFSPQTATSAVRLMSLDQAQYRHFDALIIAAADKQHLPGQPAASPFFNQSVRLSLGLSDWQQQRERKLVQFKRLLQAANDILITCKHEESGEPVPLSPWIEALQTFHALTCGGSLQNSRLAQLLRQNTDVFICDTATLPAPPEQPAPSLPAEAIPQRMSASAHQRLIDCPYKYFAGDGLRLKPPDEIREELQKSDYGERVHRILNAFHKPVRGLPQPFAEKLSAKNREAAIEHMKTISAAVFKQDLEDNALHRSWLYRWSQHIPAYIDWQIEQQQHWTVSETEKHCETLLPDTELTLYGRLDRIDTDNRHNSQQSIIDYKTGATARQADIDAGEDVQLATYALLARDTGAVMYLSLDESNGSVRTRARLAGDDLCALADETRARLQTMIDMQRAGKPLPAWGDEQTCSYCDFIGLCRRKVWSNQS